MRHPRVRFCKARYVHAVLLWGVLTNKSWNLVVAVENVDEARRARLIELLDIDLRWRMHKVSDGQRRRVQICMGLLQPFQVCYRLHRLVPMPLSS